MAFYINVMVVFVIMGRVASGQLEVDKYDNVEPFALLCRIYNVAKNPPINHVDLEEPFKVVGEIDTLNASLVEPKLPNETEQMGNSVGAQLSHTTTREAALAQLSLNQITQKAHKIMEEIKKINVAENIRKAKAEFAQVIFGENGNESDLCHATVNDMDNRSKACGIPGEDTRGNSAGKNLVVDFFCLCAQRTNIKEGVNQVCGFYVGRIDSHYGWGEQGPWGSSTMWASIKGGCGKFMQQHPKSIAEARHILDQFLKHLRTGGVYRWGDNNQKTVKGSNRKEGMLGTSACTENEGSVNCKIPACNGKEGKKDSSPGGVCLYYGTESEWQSIPWLVKFQTALETIESVNNQTASTQRVIKKLQMLLHRAEELYETTKVLLEFQNHILPINLQTAAFQNASGNLTAHNVTRTRSYGYNPNSYFFPALVLLL